MQKKSFIGLLLIGLSLTSCVKQELDKPCPLALKLNSTWRPNVEIIPVRSGSALLPIPAGTLLGIRLQDDIQTAVANYISYTAATDGSVAATNVAQTPNLLQKHSYALSIYSPFKQGATTSATFVHGEDVMWTQAVNGVKSGILIEKTLSHKMSQAVLVVDYSDQVSEQFKNNYPLANATIEVTGFYDDCTMDLATGVITPGTTRNAKMTQLGQAVCFVHLTGNETLHLTIILHGVDGTTKIFQTDYTQLLDSGVSMHFTITIDEENIQNPITITGTVQPWVDGGNTDIDVI